MVEHEIPLDLKHLSVTVAHRLFAEGAFDAASDRIADPDHGSKEDDGKGEQQRVDHELFSVISL